MTLIIIKFLATAAIIVLISEVAKFSDKLGALIASLPLITFITLFCALGTWQLYRLQWKQELIIQIDEGLKSAPTRYSNRIKNNYQV